MKAQGWSLGGILFSLAAVAGAERVPRRAEEPVREVAAPALPERRAPEGPNGFRDRWEWLHGGRPGAAGSAQRAAALQPSRTRRVVHEAVSQPLAWTQLGPLDFGSSGTHDATVDKGAGRILSIAPHPADPTTLFIDSVGGLFVTHDVGKAAWSWSPLEWGLTGSPGPGVVAFDAADPNTLYHAQSGLSPGGLSRSRDGGVTFSALSPSPLGIDKVGVVSLVANGAMLLMGSDVGLYRSADGGRTFTHPSLPSPRDSGDSGGSVDAIVRVSDSVWLAVDNDRYSMSGPPSYHGSLFRSTDGGASWSEVTLPSQFDPAVRGSLLVANSAANPSVVYLAGNKLFARSADGGATWTNVPFNATGPGVANFGSPGVLVVDPTDPSKLFSGQVELFRSTDSGASWSQISSSQGQSLPYSHANLHAAVFGNGVVYFGNDGGLSILANPYQAIPVISGVYPTHPSVFDNSQNLGRGDLLLYAIGSSAAQVPADAAQLYVLGAQGQGILIHNEQSPGGIADPHSAVSCCTGDGTGALINARDPSLWLITGRNGDVQRSTDAGKTFTASNLGADPNSSCFVCNLIQGSDPDTVLHTENSGLYRSSDFGLNWTKVTLNGVTGNLRAAGSSTSHANQFAVLVDRAPWGYTTTDGTTFKPFGEVMGLNGAPTSIAYQPGNDSVLYLSSSFIGYQFIFLWKSVDGGATWAALDGPFVHDRGILPDDPKQVVRVSARRPDAVMVGSLSGVYVSCDAGATWSEAGTGGPPFEVTDLYLAPDGSFARAATWGGGAWELQFSGTSPLIVGSPPSEVAPGSTTQLRARGGSGLCPSLSWSFAVNNSGGSITSDGVYTAGTGVNSDTIRVTDGQGNSTTVSIQVGLYVSVAPASASIPPRGSLQLNASGGFGFFTWALTSNGSQGAVTSDGLYTAGPTGSSSDVVTATDTQGNRASVSIAVTAGVAVAPATARVGRGAKVKFAASGGSGTGFTWAVDIAASGGSIDQGGVYTAGSSGGIDVVRVVDSLGNSAQATVQVGAPNGGCACGQAGDGVWSLAPLLLLLRRRRAARNPA